MFHLFTGSKKEPLEAEREEEEEDIGRDDVDGEESSNTGLS